MRDTLTDAGYAPQVTGDPEDVPRLIETKKPALVLLDLILPGTDGIALMERVPELADLPVIFISGYGRDQTIAKALEAGAADYVVKTLFAHRVGGENPGDPTRAGHAARTLSAGKPRHSLRGTPGDRGRPAGPTHRHRVRPAPRTVCQRRTGLDARVPAATGLGTTEQR